MKKLYLLLILLFFAIQHINSQTTDTFESYTAGVSTFTNGTKTFNLTSTFISFTVFQLAGQGYNSSNKFIQVADDNVTGGMGQTGTITDATGSFKVSSLWVYVSGNSGLNPGVSFNGAPGSVTFTGKLAGVTKYTIVKNTTGADIGNAAPNKGFFNVNFATDGSADYTNIIIDQLDIQLGSNYDYFAVDNFAFSNGAVAPTVTSTAASAVKSVSATLGGNVTADGGDASIERGIVWATTANPTTANNKVQIGTGTGTFSNAVTGLPAATTIHFRAYAINSGGTSYGNDLTFTTGAALTAPALSKTDVSCNGGSNGTATVTPSGGTTPYTYLWSNSATTATTTGLIAGSYSVTVTDAESTQITRNVIINQPTVLNGTASVTSVSCFGGSNGTATATPTGGTPSYTYLWSNGATTATATGLTAGTYSVTITDANSCQKVITGIVVGGPAAVLSATPSTTGVICFGGSNGTATITPSGGTSPYTYLWSNGAATQTASGLTAGTYSATITDNNSCTLTVNNITVLGPPSAMAATTAATPVSCFGGSNGTATVTASGGTGPYTYVWTPSGKTTAIATGLTAGTYSVTITDSNTCTYTVNNIIVGSPAAALSGTPSSTPVSCFGGANGTATITAAGGTSPYTYLWSNGAATATATGLTAGTYSVTITDNNSCIATINSIVVGSPAAVLSGTPSSTPVSCFGGTNGTATITAAGGTGPYTYLWSNGAATATATGLTAGTYSVTITDNNTCTATINSIVVGSPAAALTATAGGSTNVSCNGGSNGTATVNVTGGTAAYTYSWAPSGGTAATATGLAAGTYTVTVTDANSCQTTQSFTITEPAALTASFGSQTNVSCNGGTNGSATVNVTGGTSAYTYSWSPSGGTAATATGLSAGTYTVTITDANSCQATQSFTITEPSALAASPVAQTNVACFGGTTGSATVNVSGGTGGYTYSWAPSGGTAATAAGLGAGTYIVTVTDANLCQTTQSFTITEPAASLTASFGSQTNVSCNGGANGSATVNVTGGTGAYIYSWAPSGGTSATASGLTAGTYTVTVTDANSCQTTQSFTITEPAVLAATPSQTNVLCNGASTGFASVAVTGGTGAYTYSWSPSGGTAATATGLAAGTYTVTITDANSCQATQNFTITEPAALTASPVAQTNVACFGGNTGSATVTASGGTGGYTYSWAPAGGTAATAAGLVAGTYTVTVTDSNLCQTTQNFTITEPAAALTATAGGSTNVSCNGGANGSATVNVSGGTGGYTYSWAPSGGTAATAFGLAAGTYTVTVTDANSCQTTQSFTITEPAALTASFGSQTNVSCNGGTNGSATVNVTGGTGAYTYSWAPSGGTAATASGLPAGTYTVTVIDANLCQTTQSFTITEPAVLSAVPSQTNVLCNGDATGTATVNVSGGTSGYTYLWSPSGGTAATAIGLSIGNYSCLITDANGCTITENFTITQPSALLATQNQINATCSTSGEASVSVSGGTAPYSYLWSPSGAATATATGLTAGANSVVITDANGCTITRNFTITTTNSLAAITSQTDVSCFGANTGSASVVPSGAPGPFTYVWTPSGGNADTATNLTAGNYSVTITSSNGCSIVKNFTITEPTEIIVTPNPQINVSCNGGANGSAGVTVTGGTGAYIYSWAPSGGTAATANGLAAGTYTVTIQDFNLCTKTQSFTISEPAILSAATSQTDVSCNGGANGTATVNVTGGTGAYTYSWAPAGGTAATATGLSAGTYTATITDANSCQTTAAVTITEPAILAATASQTDVTCNGLNNGTATVIPTGGTVPYTYSWAPAGGTAATASGLSPGTYTATITDANGCTTTQSVTITEPSVLAVTPSHIDVSCNGGANGSATVNVTGGTGAYTYSWAPSGGTAATATGLSAGTYTATITDANGCSTTETITITQPAALSVTSSKTDVSCNGGANGTASVNVTGGTGAYTYSWAPAGGTAATATGLSAGTYTVTITDANACQTTQSFTITEPTILAATISKTDVSCNGGTNGTAAVTTAGGTAPYTYSWAPAGGTAATASGLSAGTYAATITDANGCTTAQSVTITEPAILAATISKTDVSCNAGVNGTATVTAAGGTAPYTYSWSPSGGTAATAAGLSAGTYTATITDANGCTTTQSVTITEPSVLSVTSSKIDVSCNGEANGSAAVNVTGGTGAYTYSWVPSGGTAATATGLSAGTYTATITDANGCIATESIVITEPIVLTATSTSTDVSCNGGANGTGTVIAAGGTAPYTYAWSPSGGSAATAAGLSAGEYFVTVTDANGCTTVESISITEPNALAATISKTDVSCNGGTNGTATVTVTGGTGAYTYSWTPSGGTAATATGLSAGTYTVTITDANGCTAAQSVAIITTPDVTAPVPTVANLPEITNYCSVLAAEIAIPTATDNCAGILNGTTTDPLSYNAAGTYVITWKYDDGNGNITTQPQTIKVIASPLNAVTFSNAQFTYDGNAHTLQVANLPTGATVTYSANNTSTNAGTYVVTATITPSASAPNCTVVTLTANLVINKAAQQITFGAIPVKTLGANNTFNLTAASNSNLAVTYTSTYNTPLAPATVSAAGEVNMLRSGEVLITAHQAGDNNYLPAADVSQLLVILNNNIDVKRITIGTKAFENPGKTIFYVLPCGETNPTVSVLNESGAVITPSANFTIQTPKPGIYNQNVTITSQDGSLSATYTIIIVKPFNFFDIVKQKFNNVLLVNNNPQTNGGYEFVSYEWFKNEQLIGTGQYYSAGNSITSLLDPTADYSVKMTTKDGKVLYACASKITLTNTLQAKLYPNPIEIGKVITVEADFPAEELEKMQISLYTVTGQLVKTVQSSTAKTEIQLPQTTESNMYMVVLETPNIKKSFKVIVK
ncbi:T9SS type A sorting domain-containing protein [Flavobacterium soyae]|uniref:T9SS type A sorting domain-containing protein n=1 Tax=Flavobacterium soyae TaxID=2903098 RepID=A0ABZ2UCR2_9FLAO